MNITLEQLGLTPEALQDRVIDGLCDKLLNETICDEDGDPIVQGSALERRLAEKIRKEIDEAVNRLAEAHVLPRVTAMLENLQLQETNKWGEKTGKALTFIEYLTQRAEAYMNEEVDYNGKGKSQSDSWSWKGTQTRVAHLMEKHLHYSIETAMKNALQVANSAIVDGIEKTVKLKLGEIVSTLQVSAKTK
jgi:hypothetical protein